MSDTNGRDEFQRRKRAGTGTRPGVLLFLLVILAAFAVTVPARTGSEGREALPIPEVQGSEESSPHVGRLVTVRGVVTASFGERGELGGFFLQDANGDGDERTSDGIFIYHPGASVAPGYLVELRGRVEEYRGLTEIAEVERLTFLGTGSVPEPVSVTLPVPQRSYVAQGEEGSEDALERFAPPAPDSAGENWERLEGMLISVHSPDGELVVTGNEDLGRGAVVTLASRRLARLTQLEEPGARAFEEHRRELLRIAVDLDDGSLSQNPDPIPWVASGERLGNGATLRVGDLTPSVTGVLSHGPSGWQGTEGYRIHPTVEPEFEIGNPRPRLPPAVGGSVRVAAFNVLNLFNGDGRGGGFPTRRGADDPLELRRQLGKLTSAISALDAHVLGLVELENDTAGEASAASELVRILNREAEGPAYEQVETGRLGGDEIKVGLIYQPAVVAPLGMPRVLNSSRRGQGEHVDYHADPRFDDNLNRPALAQTFEEVSTGELFTVVVVHLKSKGSSCAHVGDPDRGDGQGNCSGVRTRAARALVDWSRRLVELSADDDVLVVGDLNAYSMEDPLAVLLDGGFVDLIGRDEYTYVSDGQSGVLDHALATSSLGGQVAGAAVWHINSDEPSVLDYETDFKSRRQLERLYAPSPYRSSDHDPIIIGLEPGGSDR